MPAIVRYRGPLCALLALAGIFDVFYVLSYAAAGNLLAVLAALILLALTLVAFKIVRDFRP